MVRASLQRLAAAAPREDEVDRRKHVGALQFVDHVQQVVRRQVAVAPDAIRGLLFLRGFRPRALVDPAVHLEERQEAVVDREPHLQLDWPPVVEDGLHSAAVLGHPLSDLAVVADGGRQSDELDAQRSLDDDLLPHRAAREIVDVVDLVEDDVAHRIESLQVFVDEVAQDLGGHHDHRRLVVDGVLAGDQPDSRLAVLAHEVVELLVAQRLQRRGVDDLLALAQRAEDRVLGHDRLAARRRRADQHAAASAVELFDRLALKRIELERQRCLELVDQALRGFQRRTSSVLTSVICAPSEWRSTKVRARASISSA